MRSNVTSAHLPRAPGLHFQPHVDLAGCGGPLGFSGPNTKTEPCTFFETALSWLSTATRQAVHTRKGSTWDWPSGSAAIAGECFCDTLASLVLLYLSLTFHREPSNICLKFQCRAPERLLFPMNPCRPFTDRRQFSFRSSTGQRLKFMPSKSSTLRCYERLQTDCALVRVSNKTTVLD